MQGRTVIRPCLRLTVSLRTVVTVSYNQADEDRRLRQAYEDLPKTEIHGVSAPERHPDVHPEWVMQIIAEPYERFEEYRGETRMTVLVGPVPLASQWIRLVFVGDPEAGLFHTAYMDRRLAERYGGRPWQNGQ